MTATATVDDERLPKCGRRALLDEIATSVSEHTECSLVRSGNTVPKDVNAAMAATRTNTLLRSRR